jgi:cold shock CspA family protein
MKSVLQITFRNVRPSIQIEEWIRAEAAKLDSLYSRSMGCHVTIEVPHRHHKRGSQYHVILNVSVPQGKIVVKRRPSLGPRARQAGERKIEKRAEVQVPHKALRVAINDAFKAAGRQLQDYARRQRGQVKTHISAPEARVSKLFRNQGYGFLTSDEGREIYFHKNSVLGGGFRRLKVGSVVSFVEERGEAGPQASTVRIRPTQRVKRSAEPFSAPAA